MAKRKICVVTGTRAEYGLLRWLIDGIEKSAVLDLQLVVTGSHLSPEFGFTIQEISNDGYPVDRKIEMLLSSDTPVGITKSMGLAIIGFADAFVELQPDLVLILGDRYEIFAAASAAMIARIPIAHLHGGEVTEGAIDEAIRHSITKMSHLHFVAAKEYRNRVIQLGENPEHVFCVGGLGVDNILRSHLLPRDQLEIDLGFRFLTRNFLVTFHPVTLENNTCADQMDELLSALEEYPEAGILFTMPNADTDGRVLIDKIKAFCDQHSNAKWFESLGQLRYFSCLHQVHGVIGNSSSALLEAPSFQIGSINIGLRQQGRLKAKSVIDCLPEKKSILQAIEYLFSDDFQDKLLSNVNPYGSGGASNAIIQILEKQSFENLLLKRFQDYFHESFDASASI